jgi:hypothetical protein
LSLLKCHRNFIPVISHLKFSFVIPGEHKNWVLSATNEVSESTNDETSENSQNEEHNIESHSEKDNKTSQLVNVGSTANGFEENRLIEKIKECSSLKIEDLAVQLNQVIAFAHGTSLMLS